MEDYVLNPPFELTPVGWDSWVSFHNTTVSSFQLLINSHGSKDDLLAACGELGWVAIKCGF